MQRVSLDAILNNGKLESFLSLNELSQHFYSGWNIAFSPCFVFFPLLIDPSAQVFLSLRAALDPEAAKILISHCQSFSITKS